MEFHPVGQQECLNNFTVVQQELKSNPFSWFSVCNVNVWQCRGKKTKKNPILGGSSDRKLLSWEQVMFAQKGCNEKLLYLQRSVISPEWKPGWTIWPEFGQGNIPDSTSRFEECDDSCPRALAVGHIFYLSSSCCLLGFVEMQLQFVSHPVFRHGKLRDFWNVDLLSRDSDMELKTSNFCALCDWKHWKNPEPKAFKELRFLELHISVVYLELESHVKVKRLHSHICCSVFQLHTVLAHLCQSLGNWGKADIKSLVSSLETPNYSPVSSKKISFCISKGGINNN